MRAVLHWTSEDLKTLPDNGNRYEIIDGELYVSTAPRYEHQYACGKLWLALDRWSRQTKLGEPLGGVGVIFAEDNEVIPDVVWMSRKRRDKIAGADGHFHGAPELIAEVLSFTGLNEMRDREIKLNLYSREGVKEYWIVNWRLREVEVYRRKGRGLKPVATFGSSDFLTSPLLPGFRYLVRKFFDDYLIPDSLSLKSSSKTRPVSKQGGSAQGAR